MNIILEFVSKNNLLVAIVILAIIGGIVIIALAFVNQIRSASISKNSNTASSLDINMQSKEIINNQQ